MILNLGSICQKLFQIMPSLIKSSKCDSWGFLYFLMIINSTLQSSQKSPKVCIQIFLHLNLNLLNLDRFTLVFQVEREWISLYFLLILSSCNLSIACDQVSLSCYRDFSRFLMLVQWRFSHSFHYLIHYPSNFPF